MFKSKLTDKETSNFGKGKILLIVIIVFTIVPLFIISMLYMTNDNFKFTANKYLSTVSGPVGQYFNQFPTREERESQKREVARYLASLDVESATDKLTIIRKDDEMLYTDLVKMITQIDPQQTERILERIRENSIKKDVLTSTLEQIKRDEVKERQSRADYYQKMNLASAIEEIRSSLMDELISYKNMALIMEQMKDNVAAEILKHLDEEVARRILANYELIDKRKKVEDILEKMKNREKELIQIAQIYSVEKPEKIVSHIGNEKKYNLSDLSIIYRNMDMLQTAKVLASVEDEKFRHQLLEQMKIDQIIGKGNDLLTPDIIEAIKIYEDYDKEIKELVNVYSKMEANEMSKTITKLFQSKNIAKKYSFDNKDEIIILDQDIAIDILKNLRQRTVAEILATLDADLASQISKTLTLPN
ncbi:hypothetical protein QBE52_09190 [Clostridiaceae bacterium 35-E11]